MHHYPRPPLNFLRANRAKSNRVSLSSFNRHSINVQPRGKRCRYSSSRSYNRSSGPRQEIRTSIRSASITDFPGRRNSCKERRKKSKETSSNLIMSKEWISMLIWHFFLVIEPISCNYSLVGMFSLIRVDTSKPVDRVIPTNVRCSVSFVEIELFLSDAFATNPTRETEN